MKNHHIKSIKCEEIPRLLAAGYLIKATIEGVKNLGFPDFFRIQLAVFKVIAVLVLLIPAIPIQIKEWSYAGVGLFLITAIIAHLKHKDSIEILLILIILFAVLCVSNTYMNKII